LRPDRMKELISEYGPSYVSMDVFDTLLLRPYVRPTDLLRHVEHDLDAPGFFDARISAERLSRRERGGETTLDAIYGRLPERYRHLKDAEVRYELEMSLPNEEMRRLLRDLTGSGTRTVLITDMYLPKEAIELMLEKNGIHEHEKIYVSSESGATKRSGSLFGLVLDDLGIRSADIVHIGDDRRSDLSVPSSLGIRALRYSPPMERYMKEHSGARRFYRRARTLGRSVIVSMDMLLESEYGDEADVWRRLGLRYGGPLTSFYARFLSERLSEDAVNLFVSRDGYGVMRVMDILFPGSRSEYVYAPRILHHVLTGPSPENGTRGGGRRDAAERAEYMMSYFSEELGGGGTRSGKDAEALEILAERSEEVDGLRSEALRGYREYLNAVCGGSDRVNVIDCTTARFSSQRLLESVLEDSEVRGYYFVTLGETEELDYVSFQRKRRPVCWMMINIPEFFMCSPEFPIRRMEGPRPVFKDDNPPCEVRRAGTYGSVLEGECRYASLLKGVFGDKVPPVSYRDLMPWCALMVLEPRSDEREFIRGMQWASDPLHKEYRPIVPTLRDAPYRLRKLATDIAWMLDR